MGFYERFTICVIDKPRLGYVWCKTLSFNFSIRSLSILSISYSKHSRLNQLLILLVCVMQILETHFGTLHIMNVISSIIH